MPWVKVAEAAKQLQISRRAVYDAVISNRIKTKQVYGLTLVDPLTYSTTRGQNDDKTTQSC